MSKNVPKGIIHIFPEKDNLEAKERTRELLLNIMVDYIKNNSNNSENTEKTG